MLKARRWAVNDNLIRMILGLYRGSNMLECRPRGSNQLICQPTSLTVTRLDRSHRVIDGYAPPVMFIFESNLLWWFGVLAAIPELRQGGISRRIRCQDLPEQPQILQLSCYISWYCQRPSSPDPARGLPLGVCSDLCRRAFSTVYAIRAPLTSLALESTERRNPLHLIDHQLHTLAKHNKCS